MKLICVGRNYNDHIQELNNTRPDAPVIFIKPDSALAQPTQPFFIPDFSKDIHYEVEILVRINRIGKYIQPEFAHKYYDEIGLGIDFTARDLQKELKSKGLPWEKAKGFDGSARIGKWFSKKDFVDINDIRFRLEKNNQVVQESTTAHMIWSVDALISHISEFFTLKIGDVIFTGTPAGVGPVDAGDFLEGFIEGQQAFGVKIK
ncbi:MAG: fumarylacetoacetate hydrolase family protein [Flavobacteriaceae bacterium]|nr:fumarylacetoacetate hydrolase family protein [Flavobacteriaceae bacterium]